MRVTSADTVRVLLLYVRLTNVTQRYR